MKSLVTPALLGCLLGLTCTGQVPQAALPPAAASLPSAKPIPPHTIEFVQEQTQLLADGNRIDRLSYQTAYMNNAGATRTDFFIEKRDPNTGQRTGERQLTSVSISDPQNGRIISLDPARKTASVHQIPPRPSPAPVRAEGRAPATNGVPLINAAGDVVAVLPAAAASSSVKPSVAAGPNPAPRMRHEQLGERVIEGLVCKGTLMIRTIPAGLQGNERPMEMKSENWFCPEIGEILEMKMTDPRSGEVTRKVVRLNMGEPDPSVFEIPAGYTTETAPAAVTSPSIPLSAPPPAKK